MKKIVTAGCILLLSFISFKGTSNWETKLPGPWVAPASANDVPNPRKDNPASVTEGKTIYAKYCVVCHGTSGKGDGVAAAGLQVPPADHSSAKIQAQTDGAIYWKVTTGRSPMPGFKSTLTDEQRWDLVDYIRTLAKAKKK
jgi:mono/diheme cytochrome c family protein